MREPNLTDTATIPHYGLVELQLPHILIGKCHIPLSERELQSEAAVSLRKMVTFVTWFGSRTEFRSLELVL